jgi:hypothetical protein
MVLTADGEAEDDKGAPQCYTCELDYLNDQFALVLQQVQQANLRLEQELRQSGTKDSQPRWMRDDNGGGKKRSIGTPASRQPPATSKAQHHHHLMHQEIAKKLSVEEFNAGEVIITQGDDGDASVGASQPARTSL